MKPNILLSVCLVVGVAIVVSLAIVGKNQRKLLREYQVVRDSFQMTDEEMVDYGKHHQKYYEATKREDELAAHIALGVLVRLERGDTERAKHLLEMTISTYYRRHRHTGHTNVLAHIESYAATNASLSNAIYGKVE